MTAQLTTGSARRVTFDLDGRRIAALQSGEPGAAPVLLLPGYTGSKEDFGPVLDPLADAGYLVTAIDLPGQFESTALAASGDYAPDRLAAAVLGVTAELADSGPAAPLPAADATSARDRAGTGVRPASSRRARSAARRSASASSGVA